MKKKIIIITFSYEVGSFYKSVFEDFFGNRVDITIHSLELGMVSYLEEADLYYVGTTSSDIFEYVVSLVPDREKIVVSRLTFRKNCLDEIKKLPKGTKALVVNLSYNMAIETIADLNRNDITHIKFYPMGPENEPPADVEVAITPGELRYVPRNIKKVIDLGYRVFSESVIIEMTFKLGFNWFLKTQQYKNYVEQLSEKNYGIYALTDENVNIENRLEILIESMNIGILGTDCDRRISICNKAAENLILKSRKSLIGSFVWEINSQFKGLVTNLSQEEDKVSKLIHINGTPISVTVAPIIWEKSFNGYFLLLQRFNDEEKRHQNLRMQLHDRGYNSKYTFDDIVANCPQMVRAKDIAKKMALTDASILVTGESGTGKELFAHSIHHASSRRDMPFIAINCAALPDTLLESELFGYGEGAFTGAKKSGKQGLFEYAHKGTLFLDEIEGMSQNLQVKLLRVLQEKEIMRVGENRIIPIDVRIIAATNENILDMVKEGKFRKDLYYRINTLPIEIPPLRDRGEDIFLLAEHLCSEICADYKLLPETEDIFRDYYWDGNVRELKNILEYLKFLDKKEILPSDLPETMLENRIKKENICDEVKAESIEKLKKLCGKAYDNAVSILAIIKNNPGKNGRRSIYNQLNIDGNQISEMEIRNILNLLMEEGYIVMSVGRGGNRLTHAGERTLDETM